LPIAPASAATIPVAIAIHHGATSPPTVSLYGPSRARPLRCVGSGRANVSPLALVAGTPRPLSSSNAPSLSYRCAYRERWTARRDGRDGRDGRCWRDGRCVRRGNGERKWLALSAIDKQRRFPRRDNDVDAAVADTARRARADRLHPERLEWRVRKCCDGGDVQARRDRRRWGCAR
jgi:hypothetical protein